MCLVWQVAVVSRQKRLTTCFDQLGIAMQHPIKNAVTRNVSYLTRGTRTIPALQKRMGFTQLLLVSAGIGCTRKLVVREVVRTCTVSSHDMHLHAICPPTKSRKKLIDFHLVNYSYVCVCGHATETRGYKLLERCSTRYLLYICYICFRVWHWLDIHRLHIQM